MLLANSEVEKWFRNGGSGLQSGEDAQISALPWAFLLWSSKLICAFSNDGGDRILTIKTASSSEIMQMTCILPSLVSCCRGHTVLVIRLQQNDVARLLRSQMVILGKNSIKIDAIVITSSCCHGQLNVFETWKIHVNFSEKAWGLRTPKDFKVQMQSSSDPTLVERRMGKIYLQHVKSPFTTYVLQG